MMRIRRALIVTALVAFSAAAQEHPNLAKGFQADRVYRVGDVDNINLFNGNLTLRIPIGNEYPGNGALRYQLTLTYNSKNWDYQVDNYYQDERCAGIDPPAECNADYMRAVPSRRSNAGMGWLLSLGRVFSPGNEILDSGNWTYESADGADHAFSHPSVGCDPTVGTGTVCHTRDGSYLRLRKSTSSSDVLVEFPDGMVHTFSPVANTHVYRLTEIRDRFSNTLGISYADPVGDWTLTEKDSSGTTIRIHYVRFYDSTTWTHGPDVTTPDNYKRVVKEVELAAAGSGDQARALYQFQYTPDGSSYQVDTVPYGAGACGGELRWERTPDPKAPRLRRILLPDGTSWDFEYDDALNHSLCSALARLIFPTRGRIEWTYGGYTLPTAGCRIAAQPNTLPQDSPFSTTLGVSSKKIFPNATTTQADATWLYGQGPGPAAVNTGCNNQQVAKYAESTVTVDAPDGTRTKHYFSIWPYNPDQGSYFNVGEYGLPYTRRANTGCTAPTDSEFCLSSETFATTSSTNPTRTQYVRYDGETRNCSGGDDCGYRREAASKTKFNDDSNATITVVRSAFDGLGHYRTTSTSDSWTGIERVETTNYNSGKTAVTVTAATWSNSPADNRPGATANWLLNLYDTTSLAFTGTPGHSSAACFNATSGALEAIRVKAGSSDSNSDLIAVYERTNGNVTAEYFYGGDKDPLAGATTCGSMGTSPLNYKMVHTYASGVRNTSKYDGFPFNFLDVTVNANTGLPTLSLDTTTLVPTRYVYDASGRTTDIIPTGAACTHYAYGITESPAHITIKQWPATDPTPASATCAGSGTPLTEQHFYFDGFGRPIQTRTSTPGGWSVATTKYDVFGRTTETWLPEYRNSTGSTYEATYAPANKTTFQYDIFGRVTQTSLPDSTSTSTSYAGGGVRQLTRTRTINTNTQVTTTENYDGIGHLIGVVENAAGATNRRITTQYVYDPEGHLTSVGITGTINPDAQGEQAVTQGRTFSYDGRGFLTAETHPEIDGTTAYTYDARGHARSKTVNGGGTKFDLTFDYDGAERLTAVNNRKIPVDTAHPFQPVKEFTYGTQNDGGNKLLGKLVTATRHNYNAPDSDVTVTSTYFYGDAAAHLTTKQTKIAGLGATPPQNHDWPIGQVSYTYNDLGLPSNVQYPVEIGYGNGAPTWTDLQPQYTDGTLTGIAATTFGGVSKPAFTNGSITYAASGLVTSITHNPSLALDSYSDDHGMGRVKNISFTSWTGCTAPTITTQPASQTKTYNDVFTLSVAASGSGLAYQWYQDNSPIANQTSSSFQATATQAATYWVRVSNGCSGVASNPATISVRARAPQNLKADRTGGSITVSWSGVTEATSYRVERTTTITNWNNTTIGSTAGNSLQDSLPGAQTTYVYRVFANGPGLLESVVSNHDIESTLSYQNLAGAVIRFSDLTDIRNGLNALRAAAGWATAQWSDVLVAPCPTGPIPTQGGAIYSVHIMALRCQMDRALTQLGLPTPAYTDANDLTGFLIKAVHFSDLQDRTDYKGDGK